jgi:hypothetical protein
MTGFNWTVHSNSDDTTTDDSQDQGQDIITEISVGDAIDGLLSEENALVTYVISLDAATTYTVSLTSSEIDPFLRVRDSDGAVIELDDDTGEGKNALITFTTDASGKYFIDATDIFGPGVGSYNLNIVEQEEEQEIFVGDTIDGQLDRDGDVVAYIISLDANTTYTVSLTSTEIDPFLRVKNADGELLESDDDNGEGKNALITFTTDASGKYIIEATNAFGVGVGDYTLNIVEAAGDEVTDIDELKDSIVLSAGDSIDGKLVEDGDVVTYIVSFESDKTYTISMESSEVDPFIRLKDASGTEITSDDDNGDGFNALITFSPSASGKYFIEATDIYGDGVGNFTVQVGEVVEVDEDGNIVQDRDATTTDPDTLQVQALAASIQQGINISLNLWEDFDWEILPGRESLTSNYIGYILDENGEIILDESVYPIARVGQTVGGEIADNGGSTFYSTSLTGGETYDIDVGTAVIGGTLSLYVYDMSGLLVGFNEAGGSFASIELDAHTTGRYTVEVRDTVKEVADEDAGIEEITIDSFVLDITNSNDVTQIVGEIPIQQIVGGTDGNDHLSDTTNSTTSSGLASLASMGFAGDDVLYSSHSMMPIMVGGTGDDTYVIENSHSISRGAQSYLFNLPALLGEGNNINGDKLIGLYSQVIESGGDDNDTVIAYNNDWAWAAVINGQHLVLSNTSQSDVFVLWDYAVEESKIENFWFDMDDNGIREHYTHDEFIAYLQASEYWLGNVAAEGFGISNTTMNELTEIISKAVAHSDSIESIRIASDDTVQAIARLYQAVFDRTPDTEGLNYWIDQWEDSSLNLSLGRIADSFVVSDEFVATYGDLDDENFVTQLYANVLDRTPDSIGLDYWVSALDARLDRAEVVVGFSESLENQVNTEQALSSLTEVTPGVWDLL